MDLLEDGTFDYENIRKAVNEKTKLVTIQRSKGYQTRPSFSVKQIGELISFVKKIKPDVICMVDNCYGEFVDTIEPSDVGADIMVGSLIKNPGGGLAPIGGYIAGRKDCVENASYRMTCPGLGMEDVYKRQLIDSSSRRNLELVETMREKQKRGSLLWVLDKTKTAMGARTLRSYVEQPLIDAEEIEKRLGALEELNAKPMDRDEIREYLNPIYDLERLISRISYKSANPRDLVSFASSLEMLPYIKPVSYTHLPCMIIYCY